MFGRRHRTRNAARIPSFGRGQILDIYGRPLQECLIKEISCTGANIVPDDPKAMPEGCEIWIPHLDISVRAHVRWRKKDKVGLQFDQPVVVPQPV